MAEGVAGFNCSLVAGSQTIGKGRDVSLDMSATEIDVTTRDSSGWKEFLQGLKEWGATVDQLWVPTDAGLQALRDAYLSGNELSVVFTDDDGWGFSGTAIVTGLGKPEPLDDAVALNVTLKGTGALSVVTGTS